MIRDLSSLLSLLSRTRAPNFTALALALALTRRRLKKSSIYLFQKWLEAVAVGEAARRGGPSDNSDNSANRSASTLRRVGSALPELSAHNRITQA